MQSTIAIQRTHRRTLHYIYVRINHTRTDARATRYTRTAHNSLVDPTTQQSGISENTDGKTVAAAMSVAHHHPPHPGSSLPPPLRSLLTRCSYSFVTHRYLLFTSSAFRRRNCINRSSGQAPSPQRHLCVCDVRRYTQLLLRGW